MPMKLADVSDKELEEYLLKNISDKDYEEYDSKKQLEYMFKLLYGYLGQLKESISDTQSYLAEEKINTYFISLEIKKIHSLLRKCIKKVNDISLYSGMLSKTERREVVEEELLFTQAGEHLHIVFPSLLPKRVTNNDSLTAADIKQMYEGAFRKFFENGKHIIYSKKAVIIYTHYFKSNLEFKDHDNFETKIITDLITSWLLLDDSPRNCSIFMDYRMGENSHTEVDVIPFDELKNFLQ